MKAYLPSLHYHFAKKSLTELQWFGNVIIQMSFKDARCVQSWPAQGREEWVKGKNKAFTAKLQYSKTSLELCQCKLHHCSFITLLNLLYHEAKKKKGGG